MIKIGITSNIKKYYNALKWLTANEKKVAPIENLLVNNSVSNDEL